jgi:hypothetical protein
VGVLWRDEVGQNVDRNVFCLLVTTFLPSINIRSAIAYSRKKKDM